MTVNSSSNSMTPRWQRFLESTGGAALITVLLGGLLGNWVAGSLQQRNKERELALVAYNDYLKREEEFLQRVYQLIGTVSMASDNLITLTEPEFDLATYRGADQTGLREQRAELRKNFNTVDAQWRSEKVALGLLMNMYHSSSTMVASAWHQVEGAVTTYMDCARQWYVEHPKPVEDTSSACKSEREYLLGQIDLLTTRLETGRRQVREDLMTGQTGQE